MRRLNNINEEINRMKSLFTEERMFGNLVENEEVINESNLKVGSKGEGVKALQTLLGIESDGIFGPKTKEAVIKMQKEAGLNADGIVGPKTLEGLKKKLNLNEDESDNLEDGNKDLLNIVSKEVTGKPIVKVSAGPGKEGFNADSDGDGVPDYLQKDNPQNKKGETEPVKGPEGKTSSTKVTKGEDGTKTTKSDEKESSAEKKADGKAISRKEKKDIKKGTKGEKVLGVDLDRVDNIKNKVTCRKHLRRMAALPRKGVTRSDFENDEEKYPNGKEYIERIEWCLSNFYNVWEREGYFKRNHKIKTLMGSWDIKEPEKLSGGYKGGLYKIKNAEGASVGQIKKSNKRDNVYLFKGNKNVPLIDNSVSPAVFRKPYIQGVYDALNIDPNKEEIVIQRSMDKKKLDMGTFMVKPK